MDHATGLLDLGLEVQVVAQAPGQSPIRHADHERYALATRTLYETSPPPPEALRHPRRQVLAALARTAPWHWRPLLRTLDQARHGSDARYLRLLFRGLAVVRARPFDVAHFHFANHAERHAALRECGVLRAPVVVSVHGYDINRPLRQGHRPYARTFAAADRVVASTRFMAAQTEALGCPADRITVIPIPVRLAEFPFEPRRRAQQEPVRLLTVARLVEVKGLRFALEAVQALRQRGIAVHYTIAGDGPLRAPLEALADRLGVRDCVAFAGALPRERIRDELRRAQLFVLTSVRLDDGDCEGQGLVLQEAQASGLPVIATRSGGIPEGVAEGASALLVPERDPRATADAIEAMIARAADWPAMGAAGRRLVEQRYDLAVVSARHAGVYDELVARAAQARARRRSR